MNAKFNFTYNGTAISKQQFEANIDEDWQEELNETFEYSNGYYRATLIDDEVQVDSSDFEIFEYMSGYFSIKGYLFNQEIEVLGGDSANEDDYNREHFEEVLENWDGKLTVYCDKFVIDL